MCESKTEPALFPHTPHPPIFPIMAARLNYGDLLRGMATADGNLTTTLNEGNLLRGMRMTTLNHLAREAGKHIDDELTLHRVAGALADQALLEKATYDHDAKIAVATLNAHAEAQSERHGIVGGAVGGIKNIDPIAVATRIRTSAKEHDFVRSVQANDTNVFNHTLARIGAMTSGNKAFVGKLCDIQEKLMVRSNMAHRGQMGRSARQRAHFTSMLGTGDLNFKVVA